MRMTIKSMSIYVQHIDENISQYKIFLSQVCTPILLSDIIDKIRVLNSKLHSFLTDVKVSKLTKLFAVPVLFPQIALVLLTKAI